MSTRDGSRKSRRTPPPPPPSKSGKQSGAPPRAKRASTPDISVDTAPVGRNTMHAIWEDGRRDPAARQPMVTAGYEDLPLTPPAVQRRAPGSRGTMDSVPLITVTETPIGRRTQVELTEIVTRDGAQPEAAAAEAWKNANVWEVNTFVIVAGALRADASFEQKLAFVQTRLSEYLRGGYSSVRRVDVRPADDQALFMRVWCEVPKPQ